MRCESGRVALVMSEPPAFVYGVASVSVVPMFGRLGGGLGVEAGVGFVFGVAHKFFPCEA